MSSRAKISSEEMTRNKKNGIRFVKTVAVVTFHRATFDPLLGTYLRDNLRHSKQIRKSFCASRECSDVKRHVAEFTGHSRLPNNLYIPTQKEVYTVILSIDEMEPSSGGQTLP